MPPLRTFLPVAPVKTERTHEENQERAYIAASRRSDRSLEARVESARRASEIHKRRTGRSLRVTEQDVLNEEMYEEEDDDLPSQYRRLTAHLQTGSADFNRRLAAYLTNHVAMRSALDQAITASYAQQFPNAPQFAHNHQSVFPSPFPSPVPVTSTSPLSPTSPHPYRSTPYPMPGMRGYRSHAHHRAASISNEQEVQTSQSEKINDMAPPKKPSPRRASMPAPKPTMAELTESTEPVKEEQSEEHLQESPHQRPLELSRKHSQEIIQHPPQAASRELPQQQSQHLSDAQDDLLDFSLYPGVSPFTTSLGLDAQQLVGPALDANDPFTSSLMSGSQGMFLPRYENNFYNYAPKDLAPNFLVGMNSTLAPPASSQESTSYCHDQSISDAPASSSNYHGQYEDLKDEPFFNLDGEEGSNEVTPGSEGAWATFIDDTTWAEHAS